MQGVGVIGVHGKRLLAAELSIEVASGVHMRKAGLVERGRVAYIRLVRCRGTAGGRASAN